VIDQLPNLRRVSLRRHKVKDWSEHPFSLPIISGFESIELSSKVCFLVGENGSGKSTFIEAIAENYGFGREGGSRNINFSTSEEEKTSLSSCLRLSWSEKLLGGYFLRAESFFNLVAYLDRMQREDFRALRSYGGQSLHLESHGESFLSLFVHRFQSGGFLLLDEPEAALSVTLQLSLLQVIHQVLQLKPATQWIIATHSPILLAYPQAQILSCDNGHLKQVSYQDTTSYQLTSQFMQSPDTFIHHLLGK
jgi:predicted ATPase